MIVDCYTYTWESADQLGRCVPPGGWGTPNPQVAARASDANQAYHFTACDPADVTFVLGFTSRWLDAEISNDHVAAYVRQHPDRLLGFAGVDPSEPKEAAAELLRAREELGMPGVAVAPAAQNFHPTDSGAMVVYAEAAKLGMPIIFHAGLHLSSGSQLAYAQPVLLDEVASELPNAKIVVAQMGWPWINETIALLGKHENVFAEISGVIQQPWQAYQALLGAYQSGVIHKLLFGSAFPSATASQCIEAVYSMHHLVHGTNLPTIPREMLRGIVEHDALKSLGIEAFRPPARRPATAVAEHDADAD